MAPLAAILFLSIAFDYGYTSESKTSWPTKFHFAGDSMNLLYGTSQPFEIWYSRYARRSRIDINKGTIKKYYYKLLKKDEVIIRKIHPVTNAQNIPGTICEKSSSETAVEESFSDYLPSIENFDFLEEAEHRHKTAEVWTNNYYDINSDNENVMKTEETMILQRSVKNQSEVFPIRYTKKEWNVDNGAIEYHSIINYDLRQSNVLLKDLIVSKNITCFYTKNDLDLVLEHLHPNDPGHVDIAFHRYHKHYNKSYQNNEHEQRKEIFRENWKLIKAHNNKNLTYKLSINEFTDWTPSELQYLSDTGVKDVAVEGILSFPHTEAEIEDMVEDLPENYDMRLEGYISNVKRQGKCKSGWAFAATAAVEGAIARSNGGNLVDLSPQSLVDCTWQYNTYGCNGTFNIKSVFKYIYDFGIPTTMDYGLYLGEEGFCKIVVKSKLYKIKSFISVTSLNENALKVALYKYGPVTVVISINKNMIFYRSGVYYDEDCEDESFNHAVTVVGYGVRDKQLYWIVKNSYGENWGQDGYMLLSAYNNNCNLLNSPYYTIV